MNLLNSIIGLIGLGVGLLPMIIWAVRRFSMKRKYERVFGSPDAAFVVIPAHFDPTSRTYRMVKMETTMAAIKLRDQLKQLGWQVKIEKVHVEENPKECSSESMNRIKEKCKESTMFFLGSTRVTPVATTLVPELNSEFQFLDSDRPKIVEIQKKRDNEGKESQNTLAQYSSSIDQDKETEHGFDHGLVIKVSNPHSRRSRSVFWLAGIHAIGTGGTTEYVCSKEGVQEIVSHVGSKNFATIVKTEFSGLLNITNFEAVVKPRYFPKR